jgi:DNA-directed RNA polymerase subunit L
MSDPIVLNAVDNDDGNLVFQLSNVDKSIANGLRRTILTNIPVVVFRTSPEEENNCIIDKNTTRFNNEIVKQRLSCIPICIADPEKSIDTLLLEVKKENHSSEIVYVTTEDFKIKETNTGKYLSESETKKIFPPNAQTKCFIDFLRLRPPLADDLKGEEISLICRFSRSSAKESGMFNAACTCSYGGTQNVDQVLIEWEKIQATMEKDGIPDDEVMNAKENWFLLDAKRYVIANSFDFIVGGIGIYDNRTLVRMACNVIMRKLTEYASLEGVSVEDSLTSMENAYDIMLSDGDYTMGKLLEYMLYANLFQVKDRKITFVAFFKNHPHDESGILRVAFVNETSKEEVKLTLQATCETIIPIFGKIQSLF